MVSRITDTVWLSGRARSLDYAHLKALGIRQILTVDTLTPHRDTGEFALRQLYLIDRGDEDLDTPKLAAALQFVDAAPTLVHCEAGVSRGPAVVIAYLIRHVGMTFEQAHAVVRAARPQVDVNFGFLIQLKQFS